jgi:hypothetical protein
MKLGKLTTGLLMSPLMLTLYMVPVFLVGSLFDFRPSVWSMLILVLILVLLQYGFRWLERRIPKDLQDVDVGPRLTILRGFIICALVILCVAGIVYIRAAFLLNGVQQTSIGVVVFCLLLLSINLIERRWRAADNAPRRRAGQ